MTVVKVYGTGYSGAVGGGESDDAGWLDEVAAV